MKKTKFDSYPVTHSMAHHLVAVLDLHGDNGYARVTDITKRLDLTRGSVSIAMRSLKESGYVRQDDNQFYHLTDHGERLALSIKSRHEVAERFMVEILGLSQEQSHRESCRIEHLLEAATTRRLYALLGYWKEHDLSKKFTEVPDCPLDAVEAEGDRLCPCCGMECIDTAACSLTEAITSIPGTAS